MANYPNRFFTTNPEETYTEAETTEEMERGLNASNTK